MLKRRNPKRANASVECLPKVQPVGRSGAGAGSADDLGGGGCRHGPRARLDDLKHAAVPQRSKLTTQFGPSSSQRPKRRAGIRFHWLTVDAAFLIGTGGSDNTGQHANGSCPVCLALTRRPAGVPRSQVLAIQTRRRFLRQRSRRSEPGSAA